MFSYGLSGSCVLRSALPRPHGPSDDKLGAKNHHQISANPWTIQKLRSLESASFVFGLPPVSAGEQWMQSLKGAMCSHVSKGAAEGRSAPRWLMLERDHIPEASLGQGMPDVLNTSSKSLALERQHQASMRDVWDKLTAASGPKLLVLAWSGKRLD